MSTEIERGHELEFLLESAQKRRQEIARLQADASGVRDISANLTNGADTQAIAAVRGKAANVIELIAKSPQNESAGALSVRIGKRHLKLKKMLENAVASLFFLGVASVEPTGISALAGIERGVEFVHNLSGLLKKMSPTEIMLYDAIADIDGRNRVISISPTLKRGTEQDIKNVITQERELALPKDFDKALARLITKGAVKAEDVPGLSAPLYHVVF
jgi:hypothetical protein